MPPVTKGDAIPVAVLVERLDTAIAMITTLTEKVDRQNDCQNEMNVRLGKVETRTDAHDREIEKLRGRDNTTGLLSAVAAAIAAAIGVFIKP